MVNLFQKTDRLISMGSNKTVCYNYLHQTHARNECSSDMPLVIWTIIQMWFMKRKYATGWPGHQKSKILRMIFPFCTQAIRSPYRTLRFISAMCMCMCVIVENMEKYHLEVRMFFICVHRKRCDRYNSRVQLYVQTPRKRGRATLSSISQQLISLFFYFPFFSRYFAQLNVSECDGV